ncbi:DUF4595 domain-containing protein [Taibaiella soli]|uniref:DUF4595 domain-containing protein n=1 Tax=Taibaiella soli TaxID=1649169 RepID=A0A2W2AND3_9BACT|nr:DUF4595 domain-containing protein [Taibaiella soli]PZF73850.1 hypothetical protein DN068_05775 [Taibaiella soli]
MRKKLSCLTLLFLSPIVFFSCKKGDGNSVTPKSQISKVTLKGDGYTDQYVLSYNASGEVSKIVVSGSLSYTINYSYTAQYKVGTYESATGIFALDSTVLSNGKVIQNVHIDKDHGDTITTAYTYDNSGNLTQVTESESFSENSTAYTWQNGNVVGISSPTSTNTTTYTYDANAVFQAGDYLYVNDLIKNGASVILNKNLVTGSTATYPGTTITKTFVYDKDSKGRIIKCSEVEALGTGNVWTYEYNN